MDQENRSVVISDESRKLAAVMFTDIVGYTATLQIDERRGLARVEGHRRILHKYHQQYAGEIVQFYGDGSLSLFTSIIRSIRCAIELQSEFRKEGIPVRIGIHLGDILTKDGDVFGEGVNIASRIQDLGTPGSILISGKVERELQNHPEIQSVSLGHFRLKNVGRRIEIFAIKGPGLTIPSKGSVLTQLRRSSGLSKYVLAVAAVIIIGLLLIKQKELSNLIDTTLVTEVGVVNEMIAVPIFQNFTLDDSLQVIGDMASHWITKGLLETSKAQVVSYDHVKETAPLALASVGARQSFARSTGVINIVEGSYYAKGDDSLLFTVLIRDLQTDNPLDISIPDEIALRSNPLPAINRLLSSLKGYWESRDDRLASLPNFEAYKAFLLAKDKWISDYPEAERQLKRSISLDPNFFDPHLLLISLFTNQNRLNEVENEIAELRSRELDLSERERRLLAYRHHQIRGENKATYEVYLQEYQINPKDLFTNTNMVLYALEYVNAPEKAIEYFEAIDLDSLEIEGCAYCLERAATGLQAYTRTEAFEQGELLVQKFPSVLKRRKYYSALVKFYAKQADTAMVNTYIERAAKEDLDSPWEYLFYVVTREFTLIGENQLRDLYGKRAIELFTNMGEHWDLARTYYLLEEYQLARVIYEDLTAGSDASARTLANLAIVYIKLDMAGRARQLLHRIELLRGEYDRGYTAYYLAGIYAHLGETNVALDQLRQSVAEGMKFMSFRSFEDDPELLILKDNEEYQKIIHPLTN
jgi:class 3 adenylate cyclase